LRFLRKAIVGYFMIGFGFTAFAAIAGALADIVSLPVAVPILTVALILAPEFAHLLPGLGRSQPMSSSPEPEDRAPCLPAGPTPARDPLRTEIYRGFLKAQPPA